jgi:ABC-type uncharacterized transport system permease subunit
MPFEIKIERRLTESKPARVIVPIASLVLALLLGAGLLVMVGADPAKTYIAMFSGAFGGRYALSETLVKAIPLILTGLGVSIAFRMLFWNIGAEGQLAMGGFAASGIALFVPKLYPGLPLWATITLTFLAAMLGGAVWALIPALLKALINVNEIITTLMLNYVAVLWIEYLFYGPWKDTKGYGFPGSAQFDKSLWFGKIDAGWAQPTVILMALLMIFGFGLTLLRWKESPVRLWTSLIGGAGALVAGWLAAPYLAQAGIALTTTLTQGWLLPEGRPAAAPVALIWLILLFALIMMAVIKSSQERIRSAATGTALFVLGLASGGGVIGQVVLTILLLTGTRVHMGLAIGVAAAIFIWLLLGRTKWGYEIRVIGENPRAAEYAGISLARNILTVAMLSGALAGLAGLAEVLGVAHRLQKGLTVGYGYTAILVAWLASLNPWLILVWGILWAALLVGGDQIQITMGLPAAVAPCLQGLMVFCVLGGQFFVTHRIRFVRAVRPLPVRGAERGSGQ